MNFSDDIICKANSSVLQVIKKMNTNKTPIAAILNTKKKLIGIITDGDIRRAYELGINLDNKIIDFANLSPKVLKIKDFPLNPDKLSFSKNYIAMPVIDENSTFQYFYYSNKQDDFITYDNPVLIMAGGFGRRLKPYTDFCPKPMLTINNKPILEHIIENMNVAGFNNIHLILHHMPETFKDYFKNKKFLGKKIKMHVEEKPLGTVGGLYKFKDKINKDFFVLNGDNIVNADWKKIMTNHVNKKNKITVCTANYSVQIPYGVVETNNDQGVKKIIEKPLYNWKTICSSYCFSPSVLTELKNNTFQDMPEIINRLIQNRQKIGVEDIFSFQRIEDLIEQNKKNWLK